MSDVNTIVDEYLSIWNETDGAARRSKIEKVWAADGVYTDPLTSVSGRDGFDQVVAGAQEQFKGLTFSRGETYDENHNIARFTWHLAPDAGDEPLAIGFDVAVVDDNGQITGIYGFIDKMPAA